MIQSWCNCLVHLYSCLLSRYNIWLKDEEFPKHSAECPFNGCSNIHLKCWMAAENKTYDGCSLHQCPTKPSEPHTKLRDLLRDVKCVPHLRKQRGAGHQEITEGLSMFRISWIRRHLAPRTTQGDCLLLSRCLPLLWLCIIQQPLWQPRSTARQERCSCPWTMCELLPQFLKEPKSSGLVTCAAPVAAGCGWSLAHGNFPSAQI